MLILAQQECRLENQKSFFLSEHTFEIQSKKKYGNATEGCFHQIEPVNNLARIQVAQRILDERSSEGQKIDYGSVGRVRHILVILCIAIANVVLRA